VQGEIDGGFRRGVVVEVGVEEVQDGVEGEGVVSQEGGEGVEGGRDGAA
jgi:hypothetical protein